MDSRTAPEILNDLHRRRERLAGDMEERAAPSADVAELAGDLVELIRRQQRQIEALDRLLKDHRHKVAEGHYTPKPEW